MQLTNVNKINYIVLIVASLMILHLTRGVALTHDGDDQYFIDLLSTNDIWGILKSRYMTWSGRLGVEFVLLKTIQYSYFWMIAIPVSIFVTCYSMAVITSEKVNIGFTLLLSVLLFILIKPAVLNDAVLWVTGFYNYLLPAALAMLTVSICLKPHRYIGITKIIPLLAPFIYAYSEQIALAAILALLVVFIFSKDCNKNLCLASLILTTINFVICYLAPGSEVRAQTEAWAAFPDYLSLNIVQKASLGIYLLYTHLSDLKNTPYLILLVTALVTALITARKECLVLVACGFVALQIAIMVYIRSHSDNVVLSFTPKTYASIKTYILILLNLLSFFSLLYISIKCCRGSYFIPVALTIGAMSAVAMGLSPTVFRSGARIMFAFDLTLLLSILYVFNSYFKKTT